jgi:hypothetical protein
MACCDPGFGRPPGRPQVSVPATYHSGTPRNQHLAVTRWHAHLHGLATTIHETSRLILKSILLLSKSRPFVKAKEMWTVYFADSVKIFVRMFFCLMVEVTFMWFNTDDRVILSQ